MDMLLKPSEIDLTPFLEPDMPNLAEPWVLAGWRYACEGRICVRVPVDEADSPPLERYRRPSVHELFDRFHGAEGFQQFPAIDCCVKCKGSGEFEGACESCRGSGQCECSCCGCRHECGECKGKRRTHQVCGCFHDEARHVRLGGAWIKGGLAHRIACLPDPEFIPQTKVDEPILFRFAGGQGIVMPIIKGDC